MHCACYHPKTLSGCSYCIVLTSASSNSINSGSKASFHVSACWRRKKFCGMSVHKNLFLTMVSTRIAPRCKFKRSPTPQTSSAHSSEVPLTDDGTWTSLQGSSIGRMRPALPVDFALMAKPSKGAAETQFQSCFWSRQTSVWEGGLCKLSAFYYCNR